MPISEIQAEVLKTIAWAACGKDPGFTPEFLLDHAGRHTAYTQIDLDRLSLRVPLSLAEMKQHWFSAMAEARELVTSLPPDEIGCFYLGTDGLPAQPDPAEDGFPSLVRHRGSTGGAWPTASPYEGPGRDR